MANITKENGKENLENQTNKKTSQSLMGKAEGKSRHWVMDSSTFSQKARLEKAFHIKKTNKPRIWS